MMIVNTKNWGRHGSVMFEGRVRKILVWFPNPLSARSQMGPDLGKYGYFRSAYHQPISPTPTHTPLFKCASNILWKYNQYFFHVWKIEGCVDWLMYDFKHSRSFSLWIWYGKVVSFVSRAHACFASSAVWPICLP